MKYEPKSEEALEKERQEQLNSLLLADGEYDSEVLEVSDKPTKAGDDMITLKINVFDTDGTPRVIFDYLTAKMGWKLRHAADAFGIIDVYEAGTLRAGDFDRRSGKVKVKTQKGNKEYPNPKNVIEDYVKRNGISKPAYVPTKPALDDEIPF